jgi:hypothetical protein
MQVVLLKIYLDKTSDQLYVRRQTKFAGESVLHSPATP